MIRALHRWPGLLALALVTVLALSGAALSVFPAVERLAAPQAEAGTERRRPRRAHPGRLSGRRADPPRAVGTDHRLLVRSGRARRRRHRPRHRAGRGLRRPEPGRTLAHQSAPLAVSGRCRPHRHGGGGGGDAGAVAVRRGAGRAACGRLAALVRAPARAARRSASCRDRSDRGAWPCPVVRHRPVDDGLHLRPAPRQRRHTGHPGRGERRDRRGARRDGDAAATRRSRNCAS